MANLNASQQFELTLMTARTGIPVNNVTEVADGSFRHIASWIDPAQMGVGGICPYDDILYARSFPIQEHRDIQADRTGISHRGAGYFLDNLAIGKLHRIHA